MKDLLALYALFFKMGAVTFGGGYAMLPILRRELIDTRSWLTEEEVMDYYALSQGLPGIIAINVSVFIGYKKYGIMGAVMSALGIVSPCLLIITLIAGVLEHFQDNTYVRHALSGISIAVTALILDTILTLWKKGVKDIQGGIICIGLLLLSFFTSISPVLMIMGAACAGIIIKGKTKAGENI